MTDENTSIQMDEGDADYAAVLSSLQDEEPKKAAPSESDEGAPKETEETSADEGTEQGEAEEGDEGDGEDDPDNQEIEIKIGEETKKATLRDLKRLYGQEGALTQKSQKLAEAQRSVEALLTRNTEASKTLLARAEERFAPYANLDTAKWVMLSTQLQPAEYQELANFVATAKADVDFLKTELDGHMKAQQETAAQERTARSNEAVKELQDPVKGIKGFGPAMFTDMVAFADQMGVGTEFRGNTNASVVRLLHMAMQFAKAVKATKTVEEQVAKVIAQPKRVIKPGAAKQTAGNRSQKETMAHLRNNPNDEDAAIAALVASF